MKNIQVISGDGQIDGAELRRKKQQSKYYSTCTGSHDDNQINEAIQFASSNHQFLGIGDAYDRIFGGK